MRLRRRARAVGTALALAGLVSLPADLAHAADGGPDADGFEFSGDEVSGGGSPGDAAELAVDGRYLDTLTEGTLHYRIPREAVDSSLHVGVMTRYPLDADDEFDVITATLSTWDGTSCAYDVLSSGAGPAPGAVSSAHLVSVPGQTEGCDDEEELVLTVELEQGSSSEGLQAAGRPAEIVVFEEPTPTDADDLPEPEDGTPDWEDIGRDVAGAEEVDGGTSFAEAAELEPGGTYRVTLAAGQVRVFRVPLDWGQRLQAETYFPEPSEEDQDAWRAMDTVQLSVLDPLFGRLANGTGFLTSGFGTEVRASTAEVRWAERTEFTPAGSSVAGDHYLVIHVPPSEDHQDLELEAQLTLQTFGEAGEGAPEYPEDQEPEVPGSGSSGGGPLAAMRSFAEHPVTIAVIGVVGSLLLISGGGLLIAARRR